MLTYDWSVIRPQTGLLSLQIRGSAPRLMDATTLLPDQQEGEEDEEEEGSVGGPQLVPADSGVGQSGIHSHSNKKPCSQVLRILNQFIRCVYHAFCSFLPTPLP